MASPVTVAGTPVKLETHKADEEYLQKLDAENTKLKAEYEKFKKSPEAKKVYENFGLTYAPANLF
jgi:hypothetical protein